MTTADEHIKKGEALLTNVHLLIDHMDGKVPWPQHLPKSSEFNPAAQMRAISDGTALATAHFTAALALNSQPVEPIRGMPY